MRKQKIAVSYDQNLLSWPGNPSRARQKSCRELCARQIDSSKLLQLVRIAYKDS
ncbi:hypothetical protein [Xanthocytophaga agilis]|uniref:Uncharacterized protein n=1 Tax=Xanthocytophaga agilis TaxID=3048010 RepID=A0AAE3UEX1_9BACT|nr:hypothetical protein [Xanthocytophaga agilis]MDJ1502680.1 hypothetical protein [Xanthocytophaga agilis]